MNCQLVGTARLSADPELRYTPNGKAVVELRLAFSNSSKDKQTQQYKYSPAIWVSATLWDTMAENAAALLRKGDEVLASGLLEMEQFEYRSGDRAGTKGEKLILKMAEVTPSIRRDPKFSRTDGQGEQMARSSGSNGRSDNRQTVGAGARAGSPQPAAAAAPAYSDEPPF